MSSADVREHTFDGIEEFDNRLPNWWLWTFYLACIFSVGYWVHYHTLGTGAQPEQAYAAEQARVAAILEQRAANNPVTRESLIEMVGNADIVSKGREIFQDANNCAQCHAANGAGKEGLGPNLTDEYWVYGNDPMTIYETILKGRNPDPEKGFVGGMLAHEFRGRQFVLRATVYVLSIMNTNVPGRPPEANAKKMERPF